MANSTGMQTDDLWLKSAVAIALALRESSVALGSEIVGADGLLSYRRRVTVLGADGDGEQFLYAKYTDNARCDMQRYYQEMSYAVSKQECTFYGFLLPVLRSVVHGDRLCEVVPRCHLHSVGPSTTLLVMDDLSGQGFLPATPRLSLPELEAVLGGFGRLQAAYWLARRQLNFDLDKHVFAGGGTPFANPLSESGLQVSTIVANVPRLLDTLGKLPDVTEPDVALVKSYLDGFVPICAIKLLADLTRWESLGLVHGDFWYPNLMLRHREGDGDSTTTTEARIIDWQFCGVGKFGRDFGTLLLTSAETPVLIGSWERLIRHFYSSFADAHKAAAGSDAPLTLAAVHENCVESLHGAVLWLLWDPRPDVVLGCHGNLLAMLKNLPMQ